MIRIRDIDIKFSDGLLGRIVNNESYRQINYK